MAKTIVITGASSGIGAALARAARRARDTGRARRAARARAGGGRAPRRARRHRRADRRHQPRATSSACAIARSRRSATSTSGSTTPAAASPKPVARAHRRGARPDDDGEREVGALRDAGDRCRISSRAARGQIVNVSSFLSRVPFATYPLGLQRGEGGAQRADRQRCASISRATHPGIHVTLVMPGLVRTEFAQTRSAARRRSRRAPRAPSQTAEDGGRGDRPRRSTSPSPRSTPTRGRRRGPELLSGCRRVRARARDLVGGRCSRTR